MPSPVLIAALVVNGKTFPQPPVHSTTDFAVMASILPLIRSMATTPCTRPSSIRSRVTNHSSYRLMSVYFRDVWKSELQHVEAGLVGGEPGAHVLHAAEGAYGDPPVWFTA